MNRDACGEMRLLVQADVDGELSPAEAARVGEHLRNCSDCASLPAHLTALSAQLRQEVSYYAAPESLRRALRAQVAATAPPERARRASPPPWHAVSSWLQAKTAVPFGAGFALAAILALALVLPPGGGMPDEIVADHIRALQPGHLMDVVSTDQHTVKPWFDGRLDFAPPVKTLQEQGFPLTGGRLDYLAGRPVAVLVYQRRQHIINVFVWPERGHSGPLSTNRSGYNVMRWNQNEMAFWAVSDLDPKELAEFVSNLQKT
ncbi:MAG: anti-sigma factor [Acetobacteraceae bacterium]